MIDYAQIRYLLTEAIRYSDIAYGKIKHIKEDYIEQKLSELQYWSSSFELVRNCLYDCTDAYYGKLDIKEVIIELQEDIENYVLVNKNIKMLEVKELDIVYQNIVKIRGLLS